MSSAPRTHIQITAHTWTKGSEEAPQWPSTPHSKTCSISSFSTRDLKPQGRGIPNNKKIEIPLRGGTYYLRMRGQVIWTNANVIQFPVNVLRASLLLYSLTEMWQCGHLGGVC